MSKDGSAREGGWAGIAKWRLYSSSSSDWSTPPPSPPVNPERSFGGEIGSGCSYRAENTMTPFPIIGRYNHYLPFSSLSLSLPLSFACVWGKGDVNFPGKLPFACPVIRALFSARSDRTWRYRWKSSMNYLSSAFRSFIPRGSELGNGHICWKTLNFYGTLAINRVTNMTRTEDYFIFQ